MTDRAKLPHVEGELNYMAPMAERPRYLAYDPEPGEARSNMTHDPHGHADLRHAPDPARAGPRPRGVRSRRASLGGQDFWDDDEVRRVYYPEAERFLREHTGASRVFIFDHLQRRRVPGLRDYSRNGPRQPATRVHVDHTARSGPQRVRDLLPDEADELLKGRVQVINLWRPIKGPLEDAPLALCDARTVARTISWRRTSSTRPGSARPTR